jgi:hypothetical protein
MRPPRDALYLVRRLDPAGQLELFKKGDDMNRMNTTIAALVCASLMTPMLPLSQAVAAPVGKTSISKSADGVTLVGRRGWGPGALFGGIIAGALIATAISEGRADDRDMRRCDRDFRGFDPRSGTYIDRYGDERICPYLR